MTTLAGEFNYGFRSTSAYYDNLLGQVQTFTDNNVSATGTQGINSGMQVQAVLVKNLGSTVPSPGTIVLWDSSAVGTGVNGLAGADAAGAGVVDPTLTTGPAQGEKFLLFIYGPVQVLSSTNISAGAKVKTASSGKSVTNSPSAVADLVGGFGRQIEAATGSDQLKRTFVDFRYNK